MTGVYAYHQGSKAGRQEGGSRNQNSRRWQDANVGRTNVRESVVGRRRSATHNHSPAALRLASSPGSDRSGVKSGALQANNREWPQSAQALAEGRTRGWKMRGSMRVCGRGILSRVREMQHKVEMPMTIPTLSRRLAITLMPI